MPRRFSCPLLSKEEYNAVCVPFESIDDGSIHSVMDEHGFCIVTGVLSPDDVRTMEAKLTNELNELIDEDAMGEMSEKAQAVYKKAKEQGIAEWPMESLSECYAGMAGFLCRRGLAHSAFAWNCRFRARKIFEVLYGTNDLVTGFDTIMASNGRELEAKYNRAWPHVDRCDDDPTIPDLANWEVYQSILYLWSSEDPRSSTTVVWPGSHKDEIYGRYKRGSGRYYDSPRFGETVSHYNEVLFLNDDTEREELYRGWLENARRVTVPAGGLVIWSSKVTHQGWAGGPRLAMPVCWEPKERRSEDARRRKMMLAALGLPSTHWASLGRPHGHTARPEAVGGVEFRGDSSTVGFPMRASIDCYSLDDGVDPVGAWCQLRIPKGLVFGHGDFVPSIEDLPDLEEMLRDDVKDVL